MTVVNISLPEDLRKFVEAQVVEEGHASADEYLLAVLEEARKRKAMRNLVAQLDEALADGPAEPMTREDWDALEREAIESLRGEAINPSTDFADNIDQRGGTCSTTSAILPAKAASGPPAGFWPNQTPPFND